VEERIRIEKVLLADDQDLRLDGIVPADALAGGVRVACDEGSLIDEQTLLRGRPTCSITLDMPFPQNADDEELWGDALVGFQPLVLAAEVSAEEHVIFWEPAREARAWLRDRLFQTSKRARIGSSPTSRSRATSSGTRRDPTPTLTARSSAPGAAEARS